MTALTDSPSLIVAQYLIDQGDFVEPPSSPWPVYTTYLPDGDSIEDNAAALYDTTGVGDGRYLASGEHVQHFGLQLKVRALDYETGRKKTQDAGVTLETAKTASVVVGGSGGNAYTIRGLSLAGPALYIGLEEGTKRRFLFVLNVIATLKED